MPVQNPSNRVAGAPNGKGEAATPVAPRSRVKSGLAKVRVTLSGVHPGVMFQGKGIMEADAGSSKRTKPRGPQEEAELRAHWMTVDGKRQLCIPWNMFYQSFCAAAAQFRYTGRKTMTSIVAATVACEVDKISLGTAKFSTYEDFVRIPPRTGAMVSIGRPVMPQWQVQIPMIIDDELWDVATQLPPIIKHAGQLIGIGAWRPSLKGSYGRFTVDAFEVLE